MFEFNHDQLKKVGILLVLACLIVPALSLAGETGTEFQGMFTTVLGWASGFLGKAIALIGFIIGLGMGAARANPLPAVAGIIFALFVAVGPGVIQGIATATV